MATEQSKPKAAKSSHRDAVKKTAASGITKKSAAKKGGVNKGLFAKAKNAVTDLLHTASDAAIVAVAEKMSASGAKAAKDSGTKSKINKHGPKASSSSAKKSSAKTSSKKT